MNAEFRQLLLVGNRREKIEFIKEFLTEQVALQLETICRKKNSILVSLKYCSDYQCQLKAESENHIMISSFWFPLGLILEADLNSEQKWLDSSLADSCGMVLFLCSYPWNTAEFFENLRMIPEHLYQNTFHYPVQYCVIRWINPNQQFGSTDLVNPEKIIDKLPYVICEELKKSSETAFLASILEYPIYRSRQDFWKAVSGYSKMFAVVAEEFRRKFEAWHQKTKEFPMDYFPECPDYLGIYVCYFSEELQQKFENLTGHETFRELFSFSGIRESDDIVSQYKDKYYHKYSDVIFLVADEIYKSNIQKICFWNLTEDVKQLHSEIEQKYYAIFQNEKSAVCPKTKREYQNFLHDSKCDIHFTEKIVHFINSDMMHVIYDHILEKEKILASFLYQDI